MAWRHTGAAPFLESMLNLVSMLILSHLSSIKLTFFILLMCVSCFVFFMYSWNNAANPRWSVGSVFQHPFSTDTGASFFTALLYSASSNLRATSSHGVRWRGSRHGGPRHDLRRPPSGFSRVRQKSGRWSPRETFLTSTQIEISWRSVSQTLEKHVLCINHI